MLRYFPNVKMFETSNGQQIQKRALRTRHSMARSLTKANQTETPIE